ncbi:MAG: serine/threonine-protein phosphatase [Lachnospiraceae bacterium]|nr:serine/threonine-protein phosphatase [Lachnospiraceae bacterium]
MKLFGACATDVGCRRKVNQDSIIFLSDNINGRIISVVAVCDGVGGLESGEIASAIVIRGVRKWFDGVMEWLDESLFEPELLFSHLKDAAEAWNEEVFDYKVVNSVEMGTTMSILLIADTSYYVLQVGDSRVYSYFGNELRQLTVDASVTRIKGEVTKQYLSNYMGMKAELDFTEAYGNIEPEMLFVVCSDGFYHNLLPEDLDFKQGVRKNEKKLEAKCTELIGEMIKRGETDNISVAFAAVY